MKGRILQSKFLEDSDVSLFCAFMTSPGNHYQTQCHPVDNPLVPCLPLLSRASSRTFLFGPQHPLMSSSLVQGIPSRLPPLKVYVPGTAQSPLLPPLNGRGTPVQTTSPLIWGACSALPILRHQFAFDPQNSKWPAATLDKVFKARNLSLSYLSFLSRLFWLIKFSWHPSRFLR